MNGLDELLHKAIFQAIQNEIDAKDLRRLEQKLQERGIEFSDFISKFGQISQPTFQG